jgi:hypothetical protein
VSPPVPYDARLGLLMDAQKKIRRFLSSQLPAAVTASPSFSAFSRESSNLGRASVLLSELNQAIGAYNGRLLSPTGKIISQWSFRQPKQFLNIDGTLSSDTIIKFD